MSAPPRFRRLGRWGVLLASAAVLAACADEPLQRHSITGPATPLADVLGASLDQTFTTDADFDQGALRGVTHAVAGQLQLAQAARSFPFVNVALPASGTLAHIDVNTGAVLGEYFTSPAGMARNPSYVAVDRKGDIWVANADEASGGNGSVARVGIIVGGTRVNADGTPNAVGDYLAPPFSYNSCVDRDGDGLIATSRGLGDVRPWSNAGGADTDGGVSTATDECLLAFVRVAATNVHAVAVDANDDVWVGGAGNHVHVKLDGNTAQPVPGAQFDLGCGGSGAIVDGNGVLWSTRPLLRYDPGNGTGQCYLDPESLVSYGIALDRTTGHVWVSLRGAPYPESVLLEYDPVGALAGSYLDFAGQSGGLAVDANSRVWQSVGGGIQEWAPDPIDAGIHVWNEWVHGFAFKRTAGTSVDVNGKIWTPMTTMSAQGAARIDPWTGYVAYNGYPTGFVDLQVGLGSAPGTDVAGDMTGSLVNGVSPPLGTFTIIRDGGAPLTRWHAISWNTEPQGSTPAGSEIVVEARTAESKDLLDQAQGGGWKRNVYPARVANGVPFDLVGRFLQVRVTLERAPGGASPVLSDITVQAAPDEATRLRTDIMPLSKDNVIKVSRGLIDVAVFGSVSLDACAIPGEQVYLGDGSLPDVRVAAPASRWATCTDVNGDGAGDLLLQFHLDNLFRAGEASLQTTSLVVTAKLPDGSYRSDREPVIFVP